MKPRITASERNTNSSAAAFTIESRPEAIPPVIEAVVQLVAKSCPNLIDDAELTLALQESLANAVVHGCKNDPTKQVWCEVSCDPQRGLLVIVRDPGAGFDPGTVRPVGEDLYSDHGRGLFLIRQIMDEVSFARGGAEIRMRKYFSATPRP